jgi:hypothetical protein
LSSKTENDRSKTVSHLAIPAFDIGRHRRQTSLSTLRIAPARNDAVTRLAGNNLYDIFS